MTDETRIRWIRFRLDGKDPDALRRGDITDEARAEVARFFEFGEYWRAEFVIDPATGTGSVRFLKTGER